MERQSVAPVLSDDTLSRLAAEVRVQLWPGLSVLDAVPLAHIRKPIRLVGLTTALTVVARGHAGLDDNTYAVTTIGIADEAACIWLHREAWAELPREVARTRFTLAHEIFHCCGHADELDGLDVHAEPEHHDRLEREANFGAGQLLVGDQALRRLAQQRGGLDANAIAKRFGVSVRTAEKRLQEFSRIA